MASLSEVGATIVGPLAITVLDQVQNVFSVGEVAQNEIHHKEQLMWTKKAHHLDSISLRLDALDHAKEEIRSHYDTHVGRIDALLLVLAVIWPFALNTIQFSGPFIPKTQDECPTCVEARNPWLVGVWVFLIGVVLILPFWGILMLLRCKMKLERWFEHALAGLKRERKVIVRTVNTDIPEAQQERLDARTQQIVFRLVNIVLDYQEYLSRIWSKECSHLVHSATSLLWMSAIGALLLTALSMWVFLVNSGGHFQYASHILRTIVISGCVGPGAYVVVQWYRSAPPPPYPDFDCPGRYGNAARLEFPVLQQEYTILADSPR